MIRKEQGKYVIRSKEGKPLGSYDSEEQARKRLKQIEYFKHLKEKPPGKAAS